MAVYMSPNRQRRRIVAAGLLALLLGLLGGWLLGRATATSVDDDVNASRQRGGNVADALRTLPIEYEQLQSGTGGKSPVAFDEAVQSIVDQLTDAIHDAPWLGPTARTQAVRDVEAVQKAVAAKVSPDAFRDTVEKAATSVEDVFDAKSRTGGAA